MFWVDIYSVVDYFTIPPAFVGLALSRQWIGQSLALFIAKFHYTGPTGPDQTKSADFVGDPGGLVGSGPVGSGQARVMEFSYYRAHFGGRHRPLGPACVCVLHGQELSN